MSPGADGVPGTGGEPVPDPAALRYATLVGPLGNEEPRETPPDAAPSAAEPRATTPAGEPADARLEGTGGPDVSPDGEENGTATEEVSRQQIRGSGLLLAGRGFSTGLKFLSELIVVRYLATAEYGAWTYALSAVV
ncbi:MAG TPA: hypothetical protein VE173_01510, partial [Longimicrobiales bacterium]|nr:hypothetical protein [Longimicrobiales bacterium]